MPVLDTSFLIDFERGAATALHAKQALAGQRLIVPFQAAVEFLAGLTSPESGLDVLERAYEVRLPTSLGLVATARLAHGRRRPNWGDLHVAAAALTEGTYLVTADVADFEALGCVVWDYRKQPKPPS